jgi:RNA polymerase sigma-70 factor (ECF subfamily)
MLSTVKKPQGGPLPRDLEGLFEEHGRFVFRVAYRVTGNRAEAEDILQALFLRLLESERIGDLERNPKGYLYRAAVNMALDVVRRGERSESDDMDLHETAMPDQDREYQSTEIHSAFRHALSKLNPKAAEMFVLKHLEGYENHEIARMLDTTRGTVAVTLFQSRAFLKKSMRRFLGRR